jgi:hypothetical protein
MDHASPWVGLSGVVRLDASNSDPSIGRRVAHTTVGAPFNRVLCD